MSNTFFQILSMIGIPCSYAFHIDQNTPVEPPYIVYIGDGQNTFEADNTIYHSRNRYQVEFYFTQKDEELEADIEQALLDAGFIYEKSEDVYIEEENVFVIYYNI